MFVPQRNYDDFQNKTFRIPTTLLKRLEKVANSNNLSTNKLVIQALEYALDHLDESAMWQKKIERCTISLPFTNHHKLILNNMPFAILILITISLPMVFWVAILGTHIAPLIKFLTEPFFVLLTPFTTSVMFCLFYSFLKYLACCYIWV